MITALEIFKECGITSLPFDPGAVAKGMGIPLVTYSSIKRAGGEEILETSNDGFCFAAGKAIRIAYNDGINSIERQRWTLTHELCHVWLGHLGNEENDYSIEREVDILTAKLLCPLPVLHLCGVKNPADIMRISGVSMEAAQINFKELETRRRCKDLLISEYDKDMAALFLSWIGKYLCEKIRHEEINVRYNKY